MAKYIIGEGVPLNGRVKVDGAKNSVLPIIAASILGDSQSLIEEVPDLYDVKVMCDLVSSLGVEVQKQPDSSSMSFFSGNLNNSTAPYELVSKLRASFLVMGPMLAKTGFVRVALPGGCPIGSRPVDLHLKGFAALGAEITQGHGYIEAKCKRLTGSKIYLDFPSVGATENILMAAALADGQTIIENAAIEPEIVDLASYLNEMGACIKGAGTDTIRIVGVDKLQGCTHTVIPDRIEAGTFMVAAAITHGNITIENVVADHLKPVIAKLKETGLEIEEDSPTSIVVKSNGNLKPVDVKTLPYPGFPTDMQAQMTSFLSCIPGTSMVIETIFENRFMHISELKRMGANIKIDGRTAVIEGKPSLTGAAVKATDLRAGAALILAGLAAEGSTEIGEIQHIDRGYSNLDKKLQSLGARIERVEE